jgi:hypothetical protein
LIQALNVRRGKVGEKDGLKSPHAHLSHQRYRVEGEIAAASRNMGTDHRKEAVSRPLGLEQVGCGKLRVIGYWIGSANLKLDPESEAPVEPFEYHISARRVAE